MSASTDGRLEHLQKEVVAAKHRYHRPILVILAVSAVMLLVAWTGKTVEEGPNVIRTQKLVLEDSTGKVRATLGPGIENSAMLRVYDPKGEARVTLTVAEDGPYLILADSQGTARGALGVSREGPGLMMLDAEGAVRAVLDVTGAGPKLTLQDEDGGPRAVLGIGETTTADGRTTKHPESSLRLYTADGNMIWSAPN